MSTLTVLEFQNPNDVPKVLGTLKQLQKQNLIRIEDAAILTRDKNGKPKIKQEQDLVKAGALGGAFWGMLLGLLFLAPFAGAAIGAGIGAFTGKMSDIGINDDFIKELSNQIKPGEAALFLLTEDAVLDKIKQAIEPYKSTFRIIHTSLSREDEAKLREELGVGA